MKGLHLDGLTEEQVSRMFPFDLLMLAHVGSKSHGTHIEKTDEDSIDDIDLMGVYVGPIEAYFGFGRQETVERKFGEWGAYDCVSYELRHFVSLLVKSNPNVLGMLWMPEQHVLYATEAARKLRASRDLFATKEAFKAFSGYARGQLHRMTHFDGPARKRMQQIEEELQRRTIPPNFTPEELLGARPDLHGGKGSLKPGESTHRPYIDLVGSELLLSYRQMAAKYTSGYMGKKRRELVERFGYDAKNAAHLIRLLKMGIEFLRDGVLNVDRTGRDADELKAIKRGDWPLEKVQTYAEELFIEADQARATSPLRERPDTDAIESLLVSILTNHFDRSTR
jgi:hypothetical protein